MGQAISDAARKLLAVAVLIVAAYVLFKLVLGFVAAIASAFVAVARMILAPPSFCRAAETSPAWLSR